MIEEIVRNFLQETLDVPCFLEHEKDMPSEYIMIEKTGGNIDRMLRQSTLAIQSISTSMYNAAYLSNRVVTAMNLLIEDDNVLKVALNSDYNYTDTTTKKYRYQAVFDITHYE